MSVWPPAATPSTCTIYPHLGTSTSSEWFRAADLIPGGAAAANPGPWRTVEHVETATLHYVHWFNNHRLLEVNGDIPPNELEQAYYRQHTDLAEAG